MSARQHSFERTKQTVLRQKLPRKRLSALLDRMYSLAESGNQSAIAYLLDRVYGKPAQAMELKSSDGSPFPVVLIPTGKTDSNTPNKGKVESKDQASDKAKDK